MTNILKFQTKAERAADLAAAIKAGFTQEELDEIARELAAEDDDEPVQIEEVGDDV